MDAKDIILLLNAGYTREEITAMGVQPDHQPQPEPDPTPDPEPQPDTQHGADYNALMELLKEQQKQTKALADTIAQMQKDNAKGARQPDPVPAKMSAESVIKDFFKNS